MAGRDTQERLIDTAERLFAEHGFDGVTFKQITTEAGQRNASALQYHFGTKQALVQAIVMRRIPAINARRHQMLDEMEAGGRNDDLRAVVGAMVYPISDELDGAGEGSSSFYIRFLSQVLSNPRSALNRFVPSEYTTGITRAGALAAGLMSHLPPEIIRQRLGSLIGFVVGALADYEKGVLGDGVDRPRAEVFVENLVDTIVGMLGAPLSQETADALRKAEEAGPDPAAKAEPPAE